MDRKSVRAELRETLREGDHIVAAPRFPVVAPQHPKAGDAWLDTEANVIHVYTGDEWVQIPLLPKGL